jgi:hypothetical protein
MEMPRRRHISTSIAVRERPAVLHENILQAEKNRGFNRVNCLDDADMAVAPLGGDNYPAGNHP